MKCKSLILDGHLAAFWVQRVPGGDVEHWHFDAGEPDPIRLLHHRVTSADAKDLPSGFQRERRVGDRRVGDDRRALWQVAPDITGRRKSVPGRRRGFGSDRRA